MAKQLSSEAREVREFGELGGKPSEKVIHGEKGGIYRRIPKMYVQLVDVWYIVAANAFLWSG